MIKSTAVRWAIVLVTGAIVYGTTYGAGLYPDWSQILGGLNVCAVLICAKLTNFPPTTTPTE